jgi:hypothetical protein
MGGVLHEATGQGVIDLYTEDPVGDVRGPGDEPPRFAPPFIDIRRHGGFLIELDDMQIDALDEVAPCGGLHLVPIFITCGSTEPMRPGSYALILATYVAAADVGGHPEPQFADFFTDSLATDPDGDVTNNYEPQTGGALDAFRNVSRWYHLVSLAVLPLGLSIGDFPASHPGEFGRGTASARVLSFPVGPEPGRHVVFFIAAEEFGDGYRIVSMTGDGDASLPEEASYDYTGDTEKLTPLIACDPVCGNALGAD